MARILFFAPHPDDICLFAGGTFLKHVHKKDIVQMAVMTRDELGTSNKAIQGEAFGKIRWKELTERLKEVPSVEAHWLGFYDDSVKCNEPTIEKIHEHIISWKPDVIYLPEANPHKSPYHHPDHLTTGQVVDKAATSYLAPLRHYHSREPSLFIDIDPYFWKSLRALNYFKSQYGQPLPFYLWSAKLVRYFKARQCGWKLGCRFAEGFREVLPT